MDLLSMGGNVSVDYANPGYIVTNSSRDIEEHDKLAAAQKQ
jgi:hypothetical protein